MSALDTNRKSQHRVANSRIYAAFRYEGATNVEKASISQH